MKNYEMLQKKYPHFGRFDSEQIADFIDVGFEAVPEGNVQCEFCNGNSEREDTCMDDLECLTGILEWLELEFSPDDPIPEFVLNEYVD